MSTRRNSSLDLSVAEQARVRDMLRYLRTRYRTWETLALELHFDPTTLQHVIGERRTVSPTMAFRVARLARTSIDGLLSGTCTPPHDVCINCGFRFVRPRRGYRMIQRV